MSGLRVAAREGRDLESQREGDGGSVRRDRGDTRPVGPTRSFDEVRAGLRNRPNAGSEPHAGSRARGRFGVRGTARPDLGCALRLWRGNRNGIRLSTPGAWGSYGGGRRGRRGGGARVG